MPTLAAFFKPSAAFHFLCIIMFIFHILTLLGTKAQDIAQTQPREFRAFGGREHLGKSI
jgi:hypothetical protein